MLIRLKSISILLYIIFSSQLYAQSLNNFERINVNDGLSDNHAIDIIQDKDGFIWIATMNGLNRFDGNNYINVIDNLNEIKTYNKRIDKIVEDDFDNIWIYLFDGSYLVYNKKKHLVKNITFELGISYPNINRNLIFFNKEIAVLTYKDLGVFILDLKNNQKVLGKYLFNSEILSKKTIISSVFVEDQNNIYINSDSGLIHLEINSKSKIGKFKYVIDYKINSVLNVQHLFSSPNLYIGSSDQGLIKYNLVTDEVSTTKEINGINLLGITSIKFCKDFLILATRKQGILLVNKSVNLVYHINNYKKETFGLINDIYLEKDRYIWFKSEHKSGLFRFDLTKNQLDFYPASFENNNPISESLISFFEIDSNDNIWVGTNNSGVIYFDNKDNKLTQIRNIPSNFKSLIADGILSFFEDKNSNIWIGTKFGISKTNIFPSKVQSIIPKKKPIYQIENKFDAIYTDSYGNMWFGSNLGDIYIYDKNHNFKFKFKISKKPLVESFLEDSKGRLWIGTKGEGLLMIDLKKYKNNFPQMKIIPFNDSNSDEYLACSEIYDIAEDKEGRVWFASYGEGLHVLVADNDKFNFIDYSKYLAKELPLQIDYGRCLLIDKDSNIWFGGLNGLCRFRINENKDILPEKVVFYKRDIRNNNALNYSDIGYLYQDKSSRIWIGTNGGGLYLYQQNSNNFINYNIKDGLANNTVCSIIEDNNYNLWISTKNGLTEFNYETGAFLNFTMEDGLPSNEFTESKSFKKNETLYFGTTKGIAYLNPKDLINETNSKTRILFTELHISNVTINVDKDGPLPEDINSIKELNLKYNENNFSLNFSTDDFKLKTQKSIEYKLENFDVNWLKRSNGNITYTNIPPGDYQLNLRIKNKLKTIKSLKIKITPPFWKSKLAYFIYALLVLFTTYISIVIFKKIINLQNSLRLEKNITDFKLKFFTNISHELRTPLTLIINPIREIINDKRLENTRGEKLINIAHQNAQNLLRLVNEVLDFRKLQTKNVQLEVAETDIITFFNKITDNFRYVANKKNINFKTNLKTVKAYYWFDPEKLEKVIMNLLTNAFKFTPSNGFITVNLNADLSNFEITVIDSGEGFEFKQDDKIFNRFYKEQDAIKSFFAKGYGIGLSIVEEYVTLHRGEINLNSKIGEGTTFTVKISGEKNAYKEFEISNKSSWEVGVLFSELQNTNTILIPDLLDKEFEYNILLVEDNHELLALLSEKLMVYYNLKTARNGVEAIENLKNFTPDIIITDLLMPEMNGSELTKKLKNSFETSHIPIIMLTAKAASEDKIDGYDIGADAYLTKPFEYKLLISRINNLLKQRKVLKQKFSKDLNFETRTLAKSKEDQMFIESINDFIIQKLSEPDFRLQNLYQHLGISKTVCYQKIKGITDMSPKEFVRTIKFKEAAKLLRTTSLNVSEVADEIGYSDVNYFSRQFKKQFNQTPSQFIKEPK